MVRNRLYPSLVSGASLPGTSDKAPLPHPAYLDGPPLLDDHGHSPVTVCELEHALVGNAVLLDVVLHEVHPAPLEIFAGRRAVRTARTNVELYRSSHAVS